MGIKRDNYITVQAWMTTELGLKGNELMIYAIIYGFSQNIGNEFNGSLQYLADWTHTSKKSAFNNVKSLVEKGLIEKTEVYKGNAKYCTYKVVDREIAVENFSICRSKNYHGAVENFTTNNNSNNTNNNIKQNKEIVPPDYEEAKKYYQEKQYDFGFDNWFYHYESKAWMMGKSKIKSWKATMRTWDLNNKKKNNSYQSNPVKQDWGANIQYKSPGELEKEVLERQKFWDDYYERERKEKGITGC